MKYLDEHITSHVSGLAIPADGVYNYYIKDAKDDKILFAGNLFLTSGTTDVDVEMNDVLESLKPNGHEMALPIETKIETKGYFGNFYSVVNGANGTVVPVAMIYRYPNRKRYLEIGLPALENSGTSKTTTCLQGLVNGVPELLPHYPYADTTEYGFLQTTQLISKYTGTTYMNYNLDISGRTPVEEYDISGYLYDSTAVYDLHYLFTEVAPFARDLQYNLQYLDGFVVDTDVEYEQYYYIYDEEPDTICVFNNDDYLVQSWSLGTTPRRYTFTYHFVEDNEVIQFGLPGLEAYVIMSQQNSNWVDKTLKISFDAWKNTNNNRVYLDEFQFHYGDENAEHTYIYLAGKKVGEIDFDCLPKYYLMWQDRYGGYQSQPFDKIDTFSEAITSEKITNYRREQRLSNATITPKWEIQTGWIDEHYYPYYESIFVSPYLILFDTENNHGYNVMITDNQYTEKTYQNQQRKMFNVKLKLEQNKTQIVKY